MPFSMAANVAIAIGSLYKCALSSGAIDKERTSTPSDIALSMAAIISDDGPSSCIGIEAKELRLSQCGDEVKDCDVAEAYTHRNYASHG
ncbi:hypothetical protein CR513_61480, partial [Mucuna pruriens]